MYSKMVDKSVYKELILIVDKVLDELYIKEKYLFDNNSCERNLVFHFSYYFRKLIEQDVKYGDYSVDCDYSNNIFAVKKIDFLDGNYLIMPDFIFHKRGSNFSNLLAIEFKKRKRVDERDFYKLMKLTDGNYLYKYKLGLFIKFGKRRDLVKITYFIDGKLYDEWRKF